MTPDGDEEIEKHWDKEDAHYFVIRTSTKRDEIIEAKDGNLGTCVGRIKVYPKSTCRSMFDKAVNDQAKAMGEVTITDKTTQSAEVQKTQKAIRDMTLEVIQGIVESRQTKRDKITEERAKIILKRPAEDDMDTEEKTEEANENKKVDTKQTPEK
jgi:hypothetical protein